MVLNMFQTLASRFLFYQNLVLQEMASLRRDSGMTRAFEGSHSRHKKAFIFLDLLPALRQRIYYYLFIGSKITICSFNKDHTSVDFAKDEICQILLTCHTCYSEAMPLLYQLVNFELTKKSALQYFTWYECDRSKTAMVEILSIQQANLMPDFAQYLCYFPRLRLVIIDTNSISFIKRRFRQEDGAGVASHIKSSPWYTTMAQETFPPKMQRRFHVAIIMHLQEESTEEADSKKVETCLLNMDTASVVFDYQGIGVGKAFEECYFSPEFRFSISESQHGRQQTSVIKICEEEAQSNCLKLVTENFSGYSLIISTGFPTLNDYQTICAKEEAFVIQMDHRKFPNVKPSF